METSGQWGEVNLKMKVRFQMLLRWSTLAYDQSCLPSWPSRKMLQFVYWKCELGMLKNENLNWHMFLPIRCVVIGHSYGYVIDLDVAYHPLCIFKLVVRASPDLSIFKALMWHIDNASLLKLLILSCCDKGLYHISHIITITF